MNHLPCLYRRPELAHDKALPTVGNGSMLVP